MNWTGGNLTRHSKGSNKDVLQRQKAYFAHTRIKNPNGTAGQCGIGDRVEPKHTPARVSTGLNVSAQRHASSFWKLRKDETCSSQDEATARPLFPKTDKIYKKRKLPSPVEFKHDLLMNQNWLGLKSMRSRARDDCGRDGFTKKRRFGKTLAAQAISLEFQDIPRRPFSVETGFEGLKTPSDHDIYSTIRSQALTDHEESTSICEKEGLTGLCLSTNEQPSRAVSIASTDMHSERLIVSRLHSKFSGQSMRPEKSADQNHTRTGLAQRSGDSGDSPRSLIDDVDGDQSTVQGHMWLRLMNVSDNVQGAPTFSLSLLFTGPQSEIGKSSEQGLKGCETVVGPHSNQDLPYLATVDWHKSSKKSDGSSYQNLAYCEPSIVQKHNKVSGRLGDELWKKFVFGFNYSDNSSA